ncbi:MAG: hypothetical protein AAGI69_06285 [Cyanobacteria bacterium P01_H01_bin.21]
MWQLSHPAIKAADFRFADPDEDQTDSFQLWQDDICLINALSCVNWHDTDADFQFEICKTCGYVGCQSQGWVSMRNMGTIVGILPAFKKIDQAPERLRQEYLPPAYLRDGAIWINQSDYENLQSLITLPDFRHLPRLTPWEAAKLLQWEAPHQVLGDIYSVPKLPPNLVTASSEGSFLEQVPIFTGLLQRLLAFSDNLVIRSISPQDHIISFYLDMAGIPEWRVLVGNSSDYRIYLEPGYVVCKM